LAWKGITERLGWSIGVFSNGSVVPARGCMSGQVADMASISTLFVALGLKRSHVLLEVFNNKSRLPAIRRLNCKASILEQLTRIIVARYLYN
jgi:hypothetical protein